MQIYPLLCLLLLVLSGCQDTSVTKPEQHSKGSLQQAAFSPDASYILLLPDHKPAILRQLTDNREIAQWLNTDEQKKSPLIAISISNKTALTAEAHNLARWSLKSGDTLSFWNTQGEVQFVQLAPDGINAIVSYHEGGVDYIDMVKGATTRRFNTKIPLNALTISEDGRFLVTAEKDKLTIWNIQTGLEKKSFSTTIDVAQLKLSPQKEVLLIIDKAGKPSLVDFQEGKPLTPFPDTTIRAATFASHAPLLALANDSTIRIWDLERKKFRETLNLPWKNSNILAMIFSSDGKTLLVEQKNGIFYQLPLQQSENQQE